MKILKVFDKLYKQEELYAPYIIAEIGVNHEGCMDTAKALIDAAKEGGADAVKFQTYKAETITSKDSPAYWDTSKEPIKSQYELFKKHDNFWKDEMQLLKDYSDELDIEFMSTPFDIESSVFLNDMMDVYKISSSDLTNKPFIEHICKFDKPIILSTGASNMNEIRESVNWIEKYGNQLALLHCVLNYPTDDENANLGMIKDLAMNFPDKIIGYSDHTLPKDMKVCEIATLLGAVIIEKHFTLDKMLPGNDHYHAMDKEDLRLYKSGLNRVFSILGSFKVKDLEEESLSKLNARRSLVAIKKIPKGKIVEEDDLTFKRPAYGISPSQIDELIGRSSLQDIEKDSILKWTMFK